MKAVFWGVRGSIPTPGDSTLRWGGNSSCIEIVHGEEPPLVLDCGTGARNLGQTLVRRPARSLNLLFSHFHMDHVFGFPFFLPIYTPEYDVCVSAAAHSVGEAKNKLGQYLNGVYHPTRLRDVMDTVRFEAIRPEQPFQRGGYSVRAIRLNHPGGAVGYRVEIDGQVIAYITDTAPFAKPGEGIAYGGKPPLMEANMIQFLADADVVIYDTMYELSEYLVKMTWGHSYPEYAVALCEAANAKHLVRTNDPENSRSTCTW